MHHLLHPSNQSAMRKLRANLLEFYRLLELIQNYRLLNYMAVAKSLKKFDKNSGWHSSAAYMKRSVDSLWFQQSQVVKRLIRDVEHWYTELFTDNRRRSEAMKDLRVPNLKQKTHHFTLFRVGLYVGMSVPILFTTLVAIYQNSILESSVFGPLMSIYAGLSTPVIFMFLFAVNLWVWNMKKVNYKFVFELDPRDNLSYLQFFEFSGILFFAWTLAVYLTFMDVCFFFN
jgi:hypothetical protein